ncbi:hypothetical protein GGI12_003806 [Dipsacomyces acuminosporus]|nr:hypothetical protein GGI12_003806 [Dipsacomyces acuminosporus]
MFERRESPADALADEALLPTSSSAKTNARKTNEHRASKSHYSRLHVSLLITVICLVVGALFCSVDMLSIKKSAADPEYGTAQSTDSSQGDASGANDVQGGKAAAEKPKYSVHMKAYKDTGISLPVIPNYDSASHYSRLGYDHIYIIHRVGHPENLLRMAKVLQLLRISAEFVPMLHAPLPTTVAAITSRNSTGDASSPPSSSSPSYTKANALSPHDLVEWNTRYRIYRDMAESGYKSALILDDSVDMELNIKTIMREVHRHMPSEWDMFFPGHCGAFEDIQPKADRSFAPLRHANMPLCLHAHAISRKGLLLLLHHLKPTPSSDIFNMAIMRLKERGLLQMYSLNKPVFTPIPSPNARDVVGSKKLGISAASYLSVWQNRSSST